MIPIWENMFNSLFSNLSKLFTMAKSAQTFTMTAQTFHKLCFFYNNIPQALLEWQFSVHVRQLYIISFV